jgi:hypothetical protein
MPWSPEDTQPTQKIKTVKQPKYEPRHKRENNTGMKLLLALAGTVLLLGLITYVNWSGIFGTDHPKVGPTATVPVAGPTVVHTELLPGKVTTRTVTGNAVPGPTTTVTISPSAKAAPTVTATATATVTETKPVPGPTKTVETPGPVKCYVLNQDGSKIQIPCPAGG